VGARSSGDAMCGGEVGSAFLPAGVRFILPKLVSTQVEPEPEPASRSASTRSCAPSENLLGDAANRARACAPFASLTGLGLEWAPCCGALYLVPYGRSLWVNCKDSGHLFGSGSPGREG